jgi:hypothetical protein
VRPYLQKRFTKIGLVGWLKVKAEFKPQHCKQNNQKKPLQKGLQKVAQMVECCPSKCVVLSFLAPMSVPLFQNKL